LQTLFLYFANKTIKILYEKKSHGRPICSVFCTFKELGESCSDVDVIEFFDRIKNIEIFTKAVKKINWFF